MSRTHATCIAAFVTLATMIAGCGAAHPHEPTIEDLRARALERPNDPLAQRALAEAELLMRGGDASRAAAQIERAIALAPDDLELLFLSAIEKEVHGELSDALAGYLDIIRRAARSDDPMAPAIAEIAAAEVQGLDDAVEGYADRVQESLSPLHAAPGHIGDGARSTISDLLVDLAYRRSDLDRVHAVAAEERCVTQWRVAGPIGPRHLLGFDEELAPDRDPELRAEYDYGPGRGVRTTRDVSARGCNVHVGGGPVGGAGATYAEATLSVPTGGRWVLRLETPNAVQLLIDGERVARLDRRVEPLGRISYHAVELSAGDHRVRVKMASRHPNPVISLSATQTPGVPGGGPVEGRSLLSDFVRAQLALSRGDIVTARERVRNHLHRDGASAFLIVGAAAALNDPLRASEVRHDTARRLSTWAAERDEGAWYPRLTLAQLEANEGRDLVAIEALRHAADRWPTVLAFPLQLVDFLEQRGWHAQADEAIARALEAVPTACRPQRASLNQAQRRHRAAEVLEHAEALVRCDARSDARLTVLIQRRDDAAAVAEVTRLAALEPETDTVGELQALLNLARSRGDDAEVGRILTRLQTRMPQASTLMLMEADRLFAAGQAQSARATLDGALASEPEAMMELRRPLRAMGGASPLEEYRRDGAEVIRALEASGRQYDQPMLLVFDYTVYRVFSDGSTLELTHNIFRLSSQEAVDAMGEYEVPEGAQMLTLRTVKADGRRLEPDEIEGKDTISFPSLSPGDYIEFEYLRGEPPPPGYPNGFVGDRFYFRNYETPFDHSELTVVTPADVELVIDPRGRAPETRVETRDDTRVYRWSVDESRPFVQEPGAIPAREFFPSIAWGAGATWEQYVESLRDVLADRDVRDPAAVRLVHQIVGNDGTASPERTAQRIYQWVLSNIEDSQDVFGLAPAMLASRTGNRTRVLAYLLRMAGLDAQLGLARSFATDATASTLPDDDTYQNLVIRLQGSTGAHWLHAGSRGAPFGYVPSLLAGMDAIMLDEHAERVTLDERPLDDDLRTVEVDIDLHRDGGARVSVVETFRGGGAVLWRNQLEEIPADTLEQQFESAYVSNLLPGGELVRLVVSGREDAEGPLILRYEVEVSALARESRGQWVVPSIYRALLGPQYARVASREIPQLIPVGLALDVELRVHAPDGANVVGGPADVSLESVHGARATMHGNREGGAFVVQRSFRVPRMRITMAEYERFARFCRDADEAEASEIRVRM